MDASEEARAIIDSLPDIDTARYSLRKIHAALQHDVAVFSDIWQQVQSIGPDQDAKLNRLKSLLSTELKDKKVLIFTYYKDTARYLYKNLGDPDNPAAAAFRQGLGDVNIKRMDGGTNAKDRNQNCAAICPDIQWTP